MKQIFAQGGLGDTYIFLLKMLEEGSFYKVFHKVKQEYYKPAIKEIYNLSCKINVEFVDKPRTNLTEITSDTHEQPIEFFPLFDIAHLIF